MWTSNRRQRRRFGLAWAAFEVSRLSVEGAEAWVWLIVAGLMVALGIVGLFEKSGGKA